MKNILSLIYFIGAFFLFQSFFGFFVSQSAIWYIFFNQIFGFIFVLFTGRWFLKYLNKWWYIFSVSVVYIIVCALGRDFSRGTLMIILLPITIYLAFKALEKKLIIKNGIIVLLIAFPVSFYVFPNFFQFYHTQIVKKETKEGEFFPNVELIDREQNNIVLNSEKIIVLDFWTTSCGVCFKEFPLYDNLTEKYKEDNRIEFYSVNIPMKRDLFEKTVEIIEKYNYSFKNIYAVSENEIKEKLKITSYPNIIILKGNRIIYQGHPSYNKNVTINNFDTILEGIINK